MARSTRTSPAPPSTSPERLRHRRLARRGSLSHSDSGGEADPSNSPPISARRPRTARRASRFAPVSDDDSDEDGGEADPSNSPTISARRPRTARRASRFASVSDDDSDDDMECDAQTIDTDTALMSEDDAYLEDLATATNIEVGDLSQQLDAAGPNRAKFFAQLLDPTLDVPKRVSKDFVKDRAEKFVEVYELYLDEAQYENNDTLLEALESFLAELMDCFDHPREVIGWNPFSAFADFVEAGAALRHPAVLESCSRLTLGLEWGLLSAEDRKRIGDKFLVKLLLLHFNRMASVNDILSRWDEKFVNHSTCETCNTDPWEMFLLSNFIAMLKGGTHYIDKETASDSSSEPGDDGDDDDERMDESNGNNNDNDDDGDHGEDDDHHQQDSDSEGGGDVVDLIHIEPSLRHGPLDDQSEPPRRPPMGQWPRQLLLENYGPNAYILRIVSMDEIGCGNFARSVFKVCPSCGFRFDEGLPDESSLFYRDMERAITKARDDISQLWETIDLSDS